MTRVLITGSSALVGCALRRTLAARGDRVHGFVGLQRHPKIPPRTSRRRLASDCGRAAAVRCSCTRADSRCRCRFTQGEDVLSDMIRRFSKNAFDLMGH